MIAEIVLGHAKEFRSLCGRHDFGVGLRFYSRAQLGDEVSGGHVMSMC
jgi:hypothetical protein